MSREELTRVRDAVIEAVGVKDWKLIRWVYSRRKGLCSPPPLSETVELLKREFAVTGGNIEILKDLWEGFPIQCHHCWLEVVPELVDYGVPVEIAELLWGEGLDVDEAKATVDLYSVDGKLVIDLLEAAFGF